MTSDADEEDFLSNDRNEKQDCLELLSSSSGLGSSLSSGLGNLSRLGTLMSSSGSPSSLSVRSLTSPTRLPSTCLLVDWSRNLCLPRALILRPVLRLNSSASASPLLSSLSLYSNISAVVPTWNKERIVRVRGSKILLSHLHLKSYSDNLSSFFLTRYGIKKPKIPMKR